MALEIVGAGFGRTGTRSLKQALEQLGYRRTHHMEEVAASRFQIDKWLDVVRGGDPDWEAIFNGYNASVDFPSATYYRKLLKQYPEAKVILTVRDTDKWYRSTEETIWALSRQMPQWLALIPPVRDFVEVVDGTVWDRIFDGRFDDETFAKRVYNDYNNQVRHDVPDDRLLVFDVADGWEPLCSFLGKPIPDAPFPHRNDRAAFVPRIRFLQLLQVAPWTLAALTALVAGKSLSRSARPSR